MTSGLTYSRCAKSNAAPRVIVSSKARVVVPSSAVTSKSITFTPSSSATRSSTVPALTVTTAFGSSGSASTSTDAARYPRVAV
jgi:hypothetical protein